MISDFSRHFLNRLLLLILWLPAAVLAADLISTDIHTPAPGTTRELIPCRAYDLSGFGTQFGTHEAECKGRFAWREITGDFEVWCRVAMVSNRIGHWAAAGIMARAGTDPRAPFVKVVAHSFNRVWQGYDPYAMSARFQEGGKLTKDESWVGGYMYCIPTNKVNADIPFPNCWVRLQRTGDEFRAWFAQTPGVPTEADWIAEEFKNAEGAWQGQRPPVIQDKDGVFPKRLYVGLVLDANAEEDDNFRPVARARFREIHGLAPAGIRFAVSAVTRPTPDCTAGRARSKSCPTRATTRFTAMGRSAWPTIAGTSPTPMARRSSGWATPGGWA